MRLIYLCTECGQAITIYSGEPIGIPFARLPEAVATAADHHACKTQDP